MCVGVSNQTRYLTHLLNLANSAREPADPTLATDGGESSLPKPEIDRSVNGLEHGKLIFN